MLKKVQYSSLMLVIAALSTLIGSERAHAGECQPQWVPTFGGSPGVNNWVSAMVEFDDGTGPALYAAGRFTIAGGLPISRIARWDEATASWSALGEGVDDEVQTLLVFDDGLGGGPALYAGGAFTMAGGVAANGIAKWDGTSWSAVGSGMDGAVLSLTVFDDGSRAGPALYAGGEFTSAGGAEANHIAKWDPSTGTWSPLNSGMTTSLFGTIAVYAMTAFDDGTGSGPQLYVGGNFSTAGGMSVSNIAKWDGASWSPVSTGMNVLVRDLLVFDDGLGGGAQLYAAGAFTSAGGTSVNRIAKWNHSNETWSDLAGGMDQVVYTITIFDAGSGPQLYAGGAFTMAGGVEVNRVAKWDATSESWSSIDAGMTNIVLSLAVSDSALGDGPTLYAGGAFPAAGDMTVNSIASLDVATAQWLPLGHGMSGSVNALAVFSDGSGSGPALYLGGGFATAGDVTANRVVKWDAGTEHWVALGTGLNEENPLSGWVNALAVFDDGNGPALYAAGAFITTAGGIPVNSIARWDGTSWSPVGEGLDGIVQVLRVFDDGTGGGSALYAGGSFTSSGTETVNRIAKWDGTSWSALGAGMNSGSVRALHEFDDGSGPALYAGGSFTTAGGVTVNRIAKWTASTESWSALGSGMNNTVNSLAVLDDGVGGGPALYAAGGFTMAGGVTVNRVVRWDAVSETWYPLDQGIDNTVDALAVYDDGIGPALYAAGNFTSVGGVAVDRIARWDSTAQTWSSLGSGVGCCGIDAMTVHDDGAGHGPALYVAGNFKSSSSGDSYIAKWQGCAGDPPSSPVIIDFDSLEESGTGAVSLETYNEDGFTITVAPPHKNNENLGYHQQDHPNYAGSAGIFINPLDSFATLMPDGGGTFSVSSIDVSRLAAALPFAADVTFTANGGAITHHVIQPNFGFETFVLPETFQNITDFGWNTGLTQIDNINLGESCSPADLDCDGVVGVPDLLALLAAWGPCPDPDDCPADLDGDGSIGVPDLLDLLSNWG